MASDWIEKNLGNCFHLENGFAFKSREFVEDGIPVIKIKNIKAGFFNEQNFSYVNENYLTEKLDKVARINDILVSMSGNRHDGNPETWVGKAALFKKRTPYLINQRVAALRVIEDTEVDSRFVSYSLSSWAYQQWFISIATSSGGQANLSPKQILDTSILLPPLVEQKAIAHILGSLDDKIELNRQMNETLESMAKALFKSWFVDFDPVIDNALAAGNAIPDQFAKRAEQRKAIEKKDHSDIQSLFPDEFKFTEEMGWIPKGWESVKLDKLLEVKYGKDHKKLDEGTIPVYGSGGLMRHVNKSLYIGESILIPRKGTLSNLMFVDEEFWTVDTMFFSIPKFSNIAKYIFHHLKLLDLTSMNVGSAVPSMTTKVLNDLDILYPCENTLKEFNRLVTDFYNRSSSLNSQNETLAKLRDTLLPKLMSGELRIADAAALVDEAI